MTTVEYTHSGTVDSSAVDEVYYNENTRELVLDLHGVYYRYNGVAKDIYEELLEADSAGRYYRSVIQKTYSPATRLGYFWDLDFKEVDNTVVMPTGPSRATERRAWWSPGGTNDNSYYDQPQVLPKGEIGAVGLRTPQDVRAEAGMPKALVETDKTVVTNVFNLNAGEDVTHQRYAVNFVVNGGADAKTHNLKASSVEEAIDAVYDIADMLDLTFKIESVTVYFD